jgi:hypothetical protein
VARDDEGEAVSLADPVKEGHRSISTATVWWHRPA